MIPLSLDGSPTSSAAGSKETAHGVVVTGPVVIDGREAGPGSLFVAFVGEHADGHDHAPQAAANGAVAVLGTRATELPTVVVDGPAGRAPAARRARRRAGAPTAAASRCWPLTGSQGKTSTKDLLAAVLAEAGPTVATHGSFNNELGDAADRAARRAGHAVPGAGDGGARPRPPHRAHRPRRSRRVASCSTSARPTSASSAPARRSPRPRASWSPGCGPVASPCSTPTTSGSPRWRRWPRAGC